MTTLYMSAFDTVQGRSFYSPVRWFISVSDFCSTLLHIHTEKRTSVFYREMLLLDEIDVNEEYLPQYDRTMIKITSKIPVESCRNLVHFI